MLRSPEEDMPRYNLNSNFNFIFSKVLSDIVFNTLIAYHQYIVILHVVILLVTCEKEKAINNVQCTYLYFYVHCTLHVPTYYLPLF
jgi:hypothetical protein